MKVKDLLKEDSSERTLKPGDKVRFPYQSPTNIVQGEFVKYINEKDPLLCTALIKLNGKLIKKSIGSLLKSVNEDTGGGKNPEADKKVLALMKKFSSELGIPMNSSAELIKASIKRLGY